MGDSDADPDARPGAEGPVASVVIPAHDEEVVVGRLLRALHDGPGPGRLEVVVACNGCHDGTAAVAREHGATVVELPVASKIAALNAGDDAASAFPRFYVDADVVLTARAVEHVARALGEGGVLCAAPPVTVDISGRPWVVRAFHQVWERIPYVRDAYVGSGVFAMSEAGRARFDRFPDIVADDLFGRNLFSRAERQVVPTDPFVVQAPWTLRALLRRRVRIHAGNMQLAADPRLASLPGSIETTEPWWRAVAERPSLAPAAVPYALVNLVAKLAARRVIRRQGPVGWGRDETTRAAPPAAGPAQSPESRGAHA